MAANIFKIEGAKEVNSEIDFLNEEKNNAYTKLLYFNDKLISTLENKLIFEGKNFTEISFKDTTIDYVTFIDCIFNNCLFLDTIFINCRFKNCKFHNCNTSGSKWMEKTDITPEQFKDNFNYVDDANIAKKFYSELVDLYKKNNYIDYEKDARYYYLKSIHNQFHFQYKKNNITCRKYYWLRFSSWISDKISGYGVYKSKLLKVLSIYLVLITFINYMTQNIIFKSDVTSSFFNSLYNLFKLNGDNPLKYDIIDSLYFSFITITTIGYGDMYPTTTPGQSIIMTESIIGILLIALSLNMFTDGK